MLNLIIRKWVEPYKLLETIKQHSSVEELTFDGNNKNIIKEYFIKHIKENKVFGLYMKNVNKFYLFETNENIKDILVKNFELTEKDYTVCEDENMSFSDIDSGRAEASLMMY